MLSKSLVMQMIWNDRKYSIISKTEMRTQLVWEKINMYCNNLRKWPKGKSL